MYNVEKKGANQRCGCHASDLCLCYFTYAKSKFSYDAALALK